MKKHPYETMKTSSAKKITGFILKSMTGEYFFRVYNKDKTFKDYDLKHSDLEVTIHADCDAAFYEKDDVAILDHNPQTLGIKTKTNSKLPTKKKEV